MRRVSLEGGETVAWPDRPIEAAHVPIDCIVSVIAHGEGAEMVEAGLVGREGVAGLPLFLGQETTPHTLTCQVPGEAWRMRAEDFVEEGTRPGPLRDVLLRYTHALLALTAQGVLCNGTHALDERCARGLLSIHDRVGRDSFALTHEYLALMLAVRRPGVSVAMGSLQRSGATTYHRGRSRCSTARRWRRRAARATRSRPRSSPAWTRKLGSLQWLAKAAPVVLRADPRSGDRADHRGSLTSAVSHPAREGMERRRAGGPGPRGSSGRCSRPSTSGSAPHGRADSRRGRAQKTIGGGWPRCTALLEDALVLRQEAVLAVERLLAAPGGPAALAAARRRVEGLASDSAALLHHVETATGPRPAGAPLP